MNLHLRRTSFEFCGVFGTLCDESGSRVAYTLEHSFDRSPKLAVGTYTCKRGQHQLSRGGPFITFEVMEVPDFDGKSVSGILFHVGNFNGDSEGCILLGELCAGDAVVHSHQAFATFMKLQEGADEFILVVS